LHERRTSSSSSSSKLHMTGCSQKPSSNYLEPVCIYTS
jgi:hypothetical protein